MTLTIGSLFSGYGGLDRAIEEVFDATTAWVSDIDKGACKVLAHRFPDAPNLGDITTIDWSAVEPVDIIAGGSPCQDLSTAGRRAGMTDGTRSNLWVQMREAIAHVKPTFVVWENVRGALSATAASDLEHCPGCLGDPRHGGPALRAFGRVLGDLADLGYDAEWRGLRAADVGACHGRFRVFLLAWRREVSTDSDLAGLQGLADQAGAAQAGRHGHAEPGIGRPDLAFLPTPTSNIGQNGGPQDPDKRRAGGHSVSIEDAIHGLILLPTPRVTQAGYANDGRGGRSLDVEARLLPPPRATDGSKGGPNQRGSKGDLMLPNAVHQLLPTPSVADSMGRHERRGGARGGELLLKGIAKYELADATRWGEYAAAIARHEQAFGHPAPNPTEPGPKGQPRLSPAFVEWMMMLPAGWITDIPGVTRNETLKMLGNGVVPPQAAAALRDMKRHITTQAEETTA